MSKKPTDKKSLARVRGFTLLEVLVALAIAALGLGALLAAVATGIGNAGLADKYVEATRRAQSRLASVGVTAPLAPGEQSGDDGDGFAWRVQISQPVAHDTPAAAKSPPAPALYTVVVTISWQSGSAVKSVSLQSQCLGSQAGSNG